MVAPMEAYTVNHQLKGQLYYGTQYSTYLCQGPTVLTFIKLHKHIFP